MRHYFKPLFIQAMVYEVGVSKVLVDGGATTNLIPHFILKKVGTFDTDQSPPQHGFVQLWGENKQIFGVIKLMLS